MVGGRYTNIQVFQYFNYNVTYQVFNVCYTRLLHNVCYYIGYGRRQIVLLKSSFNYISFDLTVMVFWGFFLFKDVPDTAVSPQRKKQRKKHKRGWYLIRIKVQCTPIDNSKAITRPFCCQNFTMEFIVNMQFNIATMSVVKGSCIVV